ncbi:MAG: NAD-dependent epimerase/dehydratase family protein [Flavobacteriales bacterium]
MKVIITGSTGMIGKGVLLECLDDARIKEVLLINRRSLGMEHPKLTEVLLKDFIDPNPIKNEIAGYDVVYFCLGVSVAGMTEEAYTKITYDYTINFAKAYKEVNPEGSFFYVSGTGTDSSESSRAMWKNVKGKVENELLKMGFKTALMFRPGAIRPMRGIKSRTPLYQNMYTVIKPFWGLFERMMGDNLTNTTLIGKAMINAGLKGSEKVHLENPDINALANSK